VSGNVERLVAREHAEIDRYLLLLGQLRADPTFAMLRDAQLAGTTASRWDDARAAVRSAASRLDKWHETVAEADRLLRADPPDPDQSARLLGGRTVPLTWAETPKEDRRPPASASSEPRFSLGYVKRLVDGDIRRTRRVVADVAEVLAEVRPRLDRLTGGIDDAESLLDPTADDASRGGLSALRRSLDEVRALIMADPLALGPPVTAGRPGPAPLSRLDAIDADLARLTGALAPAAALRAKTDGQLTRLRVAVSELAALESHARDRRASLVERIAVPDLPAAPSATVHLDARLATAEARFRQGWPAGPGELDEIDSAIATASRDAALVIERADELMAEWRLLRARLDNYRIRAGRSGLDRRPELLAPHQQARLLLQAAPCDLRRAQDAVHDYMKRLEDLGRGTA
jgi:hypothetical protein